MPRGTRQGLIDTAASRGDRSIAAVELLAILASQENPDGSRFGIRPLFDTPTLWISGSASAPLAGAVIADTGPVAAGDYHLLADIGISDSLTAGAGAVLQHRDAANGATLHQVVIPAGRVDEVEWPRVPIVPIVANERIRVISNLAGGVGSLYTANILVYPAAV